MFFSIFIFIVLFLVYYIKTLEILPEWESNKEEKEIDGIYQNKIISYAFEDETGDELYLLSNRTLLYNSKIIEIPEEFDNLTSFQSNLIKLNNFLYFCSSSQILMRIDDNKLYSIPNKHVIDQLNTNYKMKCFKGYDSILVAYLGTQYIFRFNGVDYVGNFTFENSTILAINNFTEIENSNSNEYEYTTLTEDKNNYHFITFKISFAGGMVYIDSKSIPINELNVYYENIELATPTTSGKISFLFSYGKTSGEFSFYIVGLPDNNKYLNGKNYFSFFNDFKIKYAKFLGKSQFLYYSIESLTLYASSYIGLVDLENYLLLYNIKENINNNLYLYFGNHFKNNNKLFYFSGNKKISYCPFVEDENNKNCFYNFNIESSYFDISKNENKYQNVRKDACLEKKILNRYCIENCTKGFEKNGNNCTKCDILVNKLIFYKSQKCLVVDECISKNYINDSDNGICYDCADTNIDNRTKFYENNCIESCESYYLETDLENNTCRKCKERNKEGKHYYFSVDQGKCIEKEECEGEIDEYLNICRECKLIEGKKLFLPYNYSCVEKCGFLLEEKDNKCLLCNNTQKEYYEEGKCINTSCSNALGYGFNTQIFFNYNITYCMKCIDNESLSYLDGQNCSDSCGSNSLVTKDKICSPCGNNYYIERAEICLEECPKGSFITNVNTCSFCEKGKYYYNKDCISKCNPNQIIKTNYYNDTNNSISIEYQECSDCKYKIDGDNCTECNGNFYSSKEHCYECFCGGNFDCQNLEGQCDCSNSPYYYGYSCEFISKDNIYEKEMKIVSTNNRLIKSSSNYFTYELREKTIPLKKCLFDWKIYLNGTEITGDGSDKKFFITAANEEVFGVNKELFDYVKDYDDKIGLSLNITCNKEKYYDKITLKLITSFEFENKCIRGSSGEIGLNEMETNLILENQKQGENNRFNGNYLNQYLLLDYNNEKIPISDYIESDSININLICSKGFDINIKNDRLEKQQSNLYSISSCRKSNFKIDEILNSNYYIIEKIFLLISYMSNYETLDREQFKKINDFINKNISITEIINEDGYWTESKNGGNKNITYAEPKLYFSLINNFALKSKSLIKDEENMEYFFNFMRNIFNEIFKNESISNNSLSDSDIKSLFRTVDNLYDLSIKNNLNSPSIINNFIELFNNITKYLSFRTYPSEIIRLIGNRISILNYHLGEHQREISFPNINNMEKVEIKDFVTYSYDNYNFNEKICSQKVGSFFCLSPKNYENLMNKLSKVNYTINNIILSIYLMQEINQNNEIIPNNGDIFFESEDTFEKITINKNYSIIYKLFIKENNNFSLIDNDNIDIELDVEFPFGTNIHENNINSKEDKDKKNIFSGENYFEKKGWNISISPKNSDFACITKSFYKKDKYFCTTHFGYDEQKVRCSCKTKLNDEILIIKDKELSETFKDIQFKRDEIKLINKDSLFIIYIFIILLLVPIIYFVIIEIRKEDEIIKEKKEKPEIEDPNEELKTKYSQIKKYYNTGIFKFSFYLTLKKFPYFRIFNKFNNKYPIFIIYMIIYIGIFIGIILPLICFYFIPFTEKEIFINQRDINYEDDNHKNIKPMKYYIFSIILAFLAIIVSNIFIIIFLKILNFEKESKDIWSGIKTLFKDYVYYNIKSEVLLGAIWNKIKLRMIAYYYICGKSILIKNKKNNKFVKYLKHISNNENGNLGNLNKIDIYLSNDNNKKEPLIPKEFDEEDNLLDNKIINDTNDHIITRKRTKNSFLFKSGKIKNDIKNEIKIDYKNDFNDLTIEKLDIFKLDKTLDDKSKKQIEHFEKIRNKYIYVSKKRGIDIIDEGLLDSGETKKTFYITREINYSSYAVNLFSLLNESDGSRKDEKNKIMKKFILITSILFSIFVIFIIILLFLLHTLLKRFDRFILKVWLIPGIIMILIANFIIYYIIMLIGSFLLFHYYYYRKNNGCFARFLFWIFVDKTMIHIYKLRNLVTKYKREFDYL